MLLSQLRPARRLLLFGFFVALVIYNLGSTSTSTSTSQTSPSSRRSQDTFKTLGTDKMSQDKAPLPFAYQFAAGAVAGVSEVGYSPLEPFFRSAAG